VTAGGPSGITTVNGVVRSGAVDQIQRREGRGGATEFPNELPRKRTERKQTHPPEDTTSANLSSLLEGVQGVVPPDSADSAAINAKGRVKVVGATAATAQFLNEGKSTLTDPFFVADYNQAQIRGHQLGSRKHFLAQSHVSGGNKANNTERNHHEYYQNIDFHNNPKAMLVSGESNTARGNTNKVYGV